MVANPFSVSERRALRPKPHLLPVDWAERHVIVGKDSPAPGRFSRETMPLLTSPMNSICDPRYDTTAVVASTQSGKSQAMNQIVLGYWLEHQRAHSGFGIPNQQIARRVFATKIRPMLESMPALAALLPRGGAGSRGGFPSELMLNNGVLLLFMGAGSAANMSQATIRNLLVDETDKADEVAESEREADPIQQMIRRTDAHQLWRRLVYSCTVTTSRGFIWKTFQSGTQGIPWFRCPHCGEWFCFDWSWERQTVGWEDDSSPLSAQATAFYPCPVCEARLRDEERLRLLRWPLWVHDGERIERCGDDEASSVDAFTEAVVMPDAAFVARGERKQTRTVSFRWNRLTSPFTTLGHIAARLRAARDDEAEKHGVTIYDMALPYEGRILDMSELNVETVLAHSRQSDYLGGRKGRLPFRYDPSRVAVTAGVDLGKRHLYFTARAWEVDDQRRLLQSWLLSWLLPYEFPHPENPDAIYSGLEHLREFLLRGWNDSEGKKFYANTVGIDTGYQHNKKHGERKVAADYQVYRFSKRHGGKMWRAVDGRPSLAGKGIVVPEKLKQYGLWLWAIDTDLAKCEVHDQVRVPPGKNGFWHLPQNTPRDYARGMCAERRVVDFDAKNRERAEWVREDPYNHPFDCEVYAWAMARALGVKPPMGGEEDSGGDVAAGVEMEEESDE